MKVDEIMEKTGLNIDQVHRAIDNLEFRRAINIKKDIRNPDLNKNGRLTIFLKKSKDGKIRSSTSYMINKAEEEMRDANQLY